MNSDRIKVIIILSKEIPNFTSKTFESIKNS